MSWIQRQELHEILHWLNQPVDKPVDYMTKVAVRCFLNGEDAAAKIEAMGGTGYFARLAVKRAIVFMGNERLKRRMRVKEIVEARKNWSKYGFRTAEKLPEVVVDDFTDEFTHDNFHDNIDTSQDRNYGMVNVSIYAHVEVWLDDEVEKEYLINFSDYKTKEWLMRLQVWALMNEREILIKPSTPEVMASLKMFIPKEKLAV